MAISYEWNVRHVDTYPTKDSALNHYTSDLSSFTAFASLNSATVQGWVEAALTSDKVAAMKTSLNAAIAEKVTPTSVQKTIG